MSVATSEIIEQRTCPDIIPGIHVYYIKRNDYMNITHVMSLMGEFWHNYISDREVRQYHDHLFRHIHNFQRIESKHSRCTGHSRRYLYYDFDGQRLQDASLPPITDLILYRSEKLNRNMNGMYVHPKIFAHAVSWINNRKQDSVNSKLASLITSDPLLLNYESDAANPYLSFAEEVVMTH